jgi:PleD family two-component response regulator
MRIYAPPAQRPPAERKNVSAGLHSGAERALKRTATDAGKLAYRTGLCKESAARPRLAPVRKANRMREFMNDATLTVLLVDADTASVRRIRQMTEAQHNPRFELIHASYIRQATEILSIRRCDTVLLNFSPSDPAPLGSYAVLAAHAPQTPTLVLASAEQESLALKAVQQGAADYLLHDTLYGTVLVRAVRHAVERQRAEEQRRVAEEALRASERRYRTLRAVPRRHHHH